MASTDMEDLHGLVLTQVGGVLVLVLVVVTISVFWCDILCSACCDL